MALAAVDPAERADLFEVEEGWLSLTHSHEPEPAATSPKRQRRDGTEVEKIGYRARDHHK
jgi:hypothetical protein